VAIARAYVQLVFVFASYSVCSHFFDEALFHAVEVLLGGWVVGHLLFVCIRKGVFAALLFSHGIRSIAAIDLRRKSGFAPTQRKRRPLPRCRNLGQSGCCTVAGTLVAINAVNTAAPIADENSMGAVTIETAKA